jgi:hypothetical protein
MTNSESKILKTLRLEANARTRSAWFREPLESVE